MTEEELARWATDNNYYLAKQLPNGQLAGVGDLTLGRARINIGDEYGVERAY